MTKLEIERAVSPLISILINNYNYANFIDAAINSALNQSYSNLEVIIVDDGSTDNSAAIISKYTDRVKHIQKENGGQASAINYGFSLCKGDFVLILDSDDVLYNNAIKLCVSAIENSSGSVAKVQAPLIIKSCDEATNGKKLPYQLLQTGSFRQFSLDNGPASYPCPPMSGNLWSSHFLTQVLPIPESCYRTSADAYLFTLAPLFGNFVSLQEPIGIYRLHDRNSYWNKEINPKKMRREIYQYKQRCLSMEKFARLQGEQVDSKAWRMQHRYYLAKVTSLWKIRSHLPVPVSFRSFYVSIAASEINTYRKTMWIVWFVLMMLVPLQTSRCLIQLYFGLQFRTERKSVY